MSTQQTDRQHYETTVGSVDSQWRRNQGRDDDEVSAYDPAKVERLRHTLHIRKRANEAKIATAVVR